MGPCLVINTGVSVPTAASPMAKSTPERPRPTRKSTGKPTGAAKTSSRHTDTLPPMTDKRKQVLEAAIQVFGELGYRGTSMWHLARAVNLSKPALYHYVTSKEALLVELYEGVTVEGVESAKRMLRRPVPPLEAIHQLLVERIIYTCENRRLLQIFFEEEAEIPEDLTRTMRKQRRAYEDSLITLLQRGVKDGSIAFDTTPRIVVNAMLGAAHWCYKWYQPDGEKSSRELAEDITELLLQAIRARPLPRT